MGISSALYNAVSGLTTISESLNVIGDNLANVNTVGFKASTARFETVLSQTLAGATGPNGQLFGTNPIQLGLGTTLASIDRDFSQGSLNATGSLTDLAIQGRGFFILTDGEGLKFTRDGSFGLAIDGQLVDPSTGFRVQGFQAVDEVINTVGPLTDIIIPIGLSIARATSSAQLAGNFDASGDIATTGTVIDGPAMGDVTTGTIPLGAATAATLLTNLADLSDVNLGLVAGDIITITGLKGGAEISTTFTVGAASDLAAFAAALETAFGIVDGSVSIDADGSITITGDLGIGNAITEVIFTATDSTGTISRSVFDALYNPGLPTAFTEVTAADGESFILSALNVFDSLGNSVPITIAFTRIGTNTLQYIADSPFGTSVGDGIIEYDENGQFLSVDNDIISIDRTGTGAEPTLNITLDFNDMTFLSGENTLVLFSQDGFPIGTLEDFFVGNDGVITGAFSNGLTRILAQVPLALFPNQEGLMAKGDNYFVPSINSGQHIVGIAGNGGRGAIAQAFLEGSNSDIATEFTGIILAQRGFQANARTITVADNMLEEVINLAR